MPTPAEIRAVRRVGLGLSQCALAEKLNVTRRTVAYWEGGQHAITPATWRAMTRGIAASTKPCPDDVRRARRLARMSQRKAAATLGVGERTWQQWEEGSRQFPPVQWALFLDLCGLPLDLHAGTRLLAAPPGFYG